MGEKNGTQHIDCSTNDAARIESRPSFFPCPEELLRVCQRHIALDPLVLIEPVLVDVESVRGL